MKSDRLYLPSPELVTGDIILIDLYLIDSVLQQKPVMTHEHMQFTNIAPSRDIQAIVVSKMNHDRNWRLILTTEHGELQYTKILNEKIELPVAAYADHRTLLAKAKNLEIGDYIFPYNSSSFSSITAISARTQYVSTITSQFTSALQLQYKIDYLSALYYFDPSSSSHTQTYAKICNSILVSEDEQIHVKPSMYDGLVPKSDRYNTLHNLLIRTADSFYGQITAKKPCCYNIYSECNENAAYHFRGKFFCPECMKKIAAIATYSDALTMRRYHMRTKALQKLTYDAFHFA